MIGMRLHACILALAADVPTIAINYDQKVDKLIQDYGLNNFIFDMTQPSLDDYLSIYEKCKAISRTVLRKTRLQKLKELKSVYQRILANHG